MDNPNLVAYLTRFHALGEDLPPIAHPEEQPSQRGYECYCRLADGGYLDLWRTPSDPRKYERAQNA